MVLGLAVEDVERLAPDQGSLVAARKLLKPGLWPARGADAGGRLIWGECQGSGSTPYRVCAATDDLGYKCSCPSRKFPCKHSLALFWARVETPQAFAVGEPPDWVGDWLSRRRGKTGGAPAAADAPPPPAKSAAAALTEEVEPVADEKAEARAAAARERARLGREAAVLAGLDDLERWIGDLLEQGLASFPATAAKACRAAAQRLVDAKAPGLAALVDDLPRRLFTVHETQRPALMIRELGQLTLAAQAYRRLESLPAPLQADVRRLIGWSPRREDLLTDPAAGRAAGAWTVVAARSEVQPDNLRRVETWLFGGAAEAPGFAVLVDFYPVSAGQAGLTFRPGEAFSGELVFYPSAAPLRAILATRGGDAPAQWPAGEGLGQALDSWDAVLERQPFQRQWPVRATGVTIARGGDGLVAVDADGATAALDTAQLSRAASLVGLGEVDLTGLWDGERLSLFTAETAIGRWFEAA